MEEKTNKKRIIFIVFLIIITILLLWSRLISTKGLIVKEYGIINNKIPNSFNGFKIVHFSDLHYGRTIHKDELTNIVNKINELKPQIIVFTGDLIDKDINISSEEVKVIKKELLKLDEEINKYAILGNHDYYDNDSEKILTDSGFTILKNNNQLIYYKSDTPILLVGLTSSLKDKPNYNDAIKNISEEDLNRYYKIVLLHEPDQVKNLKNNNIDLILAGHSHNGQINLPFVGAIIKPNGAKIYYDEYYKINKTDLYISSGIGTSTISFRFLNKPSINFYRLYNN